MLAHDRAGHGDPVLLVHGITHRRQGWRTIAPLLAGEFDVIAVDLPGHGESPALPATYRGDVGPLADALEEFCAAIGVACPHVVGNSLGGLLALELAARGVARSATALSPAGFWASAGRRWAYGLLAGASAAFGRIPDAAFGRLLAHPAGRTALVGAIVAHPERIAVDDLVGDLDGLKHPRASFPVMLDALADWRLSGRPSVPTVVGWGTRDHLLPIGQHQRLQAQLPDAEVYTLPGCGHVPMADDPDAVADLVRYAASR